MRTVSDMPAFVAAARERAEERREFIDPADNAIVAVLGEITADTPVDVCSQLLLAEHQPITLIIDSHGGKLDAALDVRDLLDAYREANGVKITTRVVREALSSANLILQAGDVRQAAMFAEVGVHLPTYEHDAADVTVTAELLHDATTRAGLSDELRRHAIAELGRVLDAAEASVQIIAQRTGRPVDEWRRRMVADERYGAYRAQQLGLVDEVED